MQVSPQSCIQELKGGSGEHAEHTGHLQGIQPAGRMLERGLQQAHSRGDIPVQQAELRQAQQRER